MIIRIKNVLAMPSLTNNSDDLGFSLVDFPFLSVIGCFLYRSEKMSTIMVKL